MVARGAINPKGMWLMWIMVSGPYTAGAADAAQRRANLHAMNEAAVALHRLGHVPIIGVNMALPMVAAAGGTVADYETIMMPVSLALIERCDACLRIGGASKGADDEMQRFRLLGRPIYGSLSEIPQA